MLVLLSSQFTQGNLNGEFFQDLPYFTDEQLERLLDFIESVEQGRSLIGKNKSSWQNNQGKPIPNTEAYQKGNCWHYHCGPYESQIPHCYTLNLAWNVQGLTSSAVLHYQKISTDAIFILAYSPKHLPFPHENFPNNPLLRRLQ